MPKILAEGLLDDDRVKWDKWCVFSLGFLRREANSVCCSREIFFCDERLVPLDHPDSTFAAYEAALFSKVPIPAWQIHSIKSLADLATEPVPAAAAEEIAADYETQLLASFPDVNGPGALGELSIRDFGASLTIFSSPRPQSWPSSLRSRPSRNGSRWCAYSNFDKRAPHSRSPQDIAQASSPTTPSSPNATGGSPTSATPPNPPPAASPSPSPSSPPLVDSPSSAPAPRKPLRSPMRSIRELRRRIRTRLRRG